MKYFSRSFRVGRRCDVPCTCHTLKMYWLYWLAMQNDVITMMFKSWNSRSYIIHQVKKLLGSLVVALGSCHQRRLDSQRIFQHFEHIMTNVTVSLEGKKMSLKSKFQTLINFKSHTYP